MQQDEAETTVPMISANISESHLVSAQLIDGIYPENCGLPEAA